MRYAPSMPSGDVRILVVDDHQPMREILKTLLFGLGVRQVDEARDTAQAFELLNVNTYDVLLTDYDMSGDTGVALVNRLRRHEGPNRRIGVIMITGRGEGPVIFAARDAGVDEYLIKPLTAAALSQKLEATLQRRRPFIETPSYVGPCRRRRHSAYQGAERRSRLALASA